MSAITRWMRGLCLFSAMMLAATVRADSPGTVDTFFSKAKPIVDGRLRFESVEQDGAARTARALTLRGRFGFESGQVAKTSLLAEGEIIRPLLEDYNSTTNGKLAYPVIADPRSSEVNRLQLTNTSLPLTTIVVGRQRVVLDDQRFVGNVGWRQNEQTFDAVRITNKSLPGLTLDLTYLDQVNRVFGRHSPQGRYRGDGVLANASYETAIGKLSAFAYRIAIDPIASVPSAVRDSSQTLGARLAGSRPLGGVQWTYAASYANQHDIADNPARFDLDYYLAEISGTHGPYTFGFGMETLAGDSRKGFTTPLGTLHKFQGWADKFLTTPPNGIDDRYVNVGVTKQRFASMDAFSAVASVHRYEAERGSLRYGSEVDLQLQARWGSVTGTLKYADYRADRLLTDTAKLWLQVEYVW